MQGAVRHHHRKGQGSDLEDLTRVPVEVEDWVWAVPVVMGLGTEAPESVKGEADPRGSEWAKVWEKVSGKVSGKE